MDPWQDLPLWLPRETAATAWVVDTTRARELGLPVRPVRDSVADTWAWLRDAGELTPPPRGLDRPGLDPDREAALLAGRR